VSSRLLRAGSVLALGIVCALSAAVLVQHLTRQRAVGELCEAVAANDWTGALEGSEGLPGGDAEGRLAAECRCWALLALDRTEECTQTLDAVLEDPAAADWLPDPSLVKLWVRGRLSEGRPDGAVDLVQRATHTHPEDLDLVQLELMVRSAGEGEDLVLADLEARLSSRDSIAVRLVLASAHERRGDAESALRVLGEADPVAEEPLVSFWFDGRARAQASLGRLAAVQETFAAWQRTGADPVELQARYALTLSLSHLLDPEQPWIPLLRDALDVAESDLSPVLHQLLYERLIGHLLADGRRDDALRVYDEASEHFELASITRDQLERGVSVAQAAGDPTGAARGVLEFRLPEGALPGTLLVSPEPNAAPDSAWQEVELALTPVRVERALGAWPQRWVLRDESGRTRASGSVWPLAGRTAVVQIQPGPPVTPHAFVPEQQKPGDGRRRVFVVLPDCGDWRLVQYLRTRGELPVLDHLVRTGTSAVLDSFPPLTASAMENLVWPMRGRQITFLGLVHHLGVELAGLSSVGSNPLGFLSAVLPEGDSLFDTVGARDRVAANMLFSHGMIDAGRHAELVGPEGRRREARSIQAFRPLTKQERERFPALTDPASPRLRPLIETLAAELDAAHALAEESDVDLLMLRIEPLDILTHALFQDLTGTRQDDGEARLLTVYRYLDERLGELLGALDADDVLVVLSDHGIRTPLEHERDALFVAAGGGLAAGRVPGRPDLRGVPRALAGLLGIETQWPETGIGRGVELALSEPPRVAAAETGE
jgi:hypothetical protein